MPFRTDGFDFRLRFEPELMIRAGEIDLKRRSVSRFTVDQDVSGALLDNAVYGGQAQTGAFAHLFGGEEGLEDARHGSRVHAAAGITDREYDVFSCCYGLMLLGGGIVKHHGTSFENELTTTRHGVARVHREVYHDLVELAGIRFDHCCG